MITQPKNRLRLAAAMGILLATGYSGAASAACVYKIDNEWNSGATGTITITNSTAATINGWSVAILTTQLIWVGTVHFRRAKRPVLVSS
jgi:hypothetical protein